MNAASGVDRRTWTLSIERVAAGVAALDADVAALQEVDHLLGRTGEIDQTSVVAAACGAGWTHRFAAAVHGTPGDLRTFRSAAATLPGEPSYGVALFTRHEVVGWHEYRMPAGRGRLPVPLPGGRLLLVPDEPRVALAAELRTSLGPLTVVTTHLSFSPLHAARQLGRLVAWTGHLPRPLVLLDDLNLPGGLPARITGWCRLLRGPTYPSSRPRVQLDHVLLDDPARTLRVLRAGLTVVAGSDHRAPVVDLEVR